MKKSLTFSAATQREVSAEERVALITIMPTREKVAYFGAGPAPLPTPILAAGAEAFLNFENSGLSLAEISHRSTRANKVLEDTKAAFISLLGIPDNYEIIFMHGGGCGEFGAVVFNMVAVWVERRRRLAEKELTADEAAILERVRRELREELRLDYLVTGSWSLRASQEAADLLEPLGNDFVNVALDARASNGGKFGNIPEEDTWNLTPTRDEGGKGSAFIYYCDNETVDGVEFPGYPKILESSAGSSSDERLIVADMSSNFLSRPVDVSKYAVIFGGAQKNIGITDVTLVIIRKDILQTVPSPAFLHAVGIWSPPTIFKWHIIAKNNSLYNTMPIFSIWIAGQVMNSLLITHKSNRLAGQEKVANAKAKIIYDILDARPEVYQVVPRKSCRSRMNICFRVYGGDATSEKAFLAGAEERYLQGLKGHRSVGGIRASNYNAVLMEKVERLATYLVEFANRPRTEPLTAA